MGTSQPDLAQPWWFEVVRRRSAGAGRCGRRRFGRATDPPHLDFPRRKLRWRVERVELDPGCGEHDVTGELDCGRLAARQVRGLVPLNGQRADLRRILLHRCQRPGHLDRNRREPGSMRATSRTGDDAPARSPSSRATATRNPGDRPVNPRRRGRVIARVLARCRRSNPHRLAVSGRPRGQPSRRPAPRPGSVTRTHRW
jgi:hypothetical protein